MESKYKHITLINGLPQLTYNIPISVSLTFVNPNKSIVATLWATVSMIIQLWVCPKVTATATLWDRALNMSREPLSSMIQMKNMLTAKTESRETASHASLPLFLGLIRARHAHNLQTDNAARQVATAVGTADARVDASSQERVPRLERG